MLELNKWFFVQLANFLLLLVILNVILFRPVLRLFSEREKNTRGALDDAKSMHHEKDEVLAQIDARISDTRNQARDIFEKLAHEGMTEQKKSIESAQDEAAEINRKSKEEIHAATESAMKSLSAEIEAFSRQIIKKLVAT